MIYLVHSTIRNLSNHGQNYIAIIQALFVCLFSVMFKSLQLYNSPAGVEGQAEAGACLTGSWRGKEKRNKGVCKNTVSAPQLRALLNSYLIRIILNSY